MKTGKEKQFDHSESNPQRFAGTIVAMCMYTSSGLYRVACHAAFATRKELITFLKELRHTRPDLKVLDSQKVLRARRAFDPPQQRRLRR